MVRFSQKLSYFLLWLTVFTVPFQKSFIVPGLGSINKVIGILLVIVSIIALLIKKEIKKVPVFYILLTLFIFLNVTSFYWAKVPIDALGKSSLLLQLSFIAWTIYEFASERDRLNGLIKAFILGCSVIAIQTLYQYLTVGSNPIISSSRFFIEGYNPNELGILWSFGLAMAMYLIVIGSRVFLFFVPLSVYSIFLTGSRTAFILLGFVGICTFWMLFRYKVTFRKIIALLLVSVSIYVIKQIPGEQLSRLSTIEYELTNGTINGRTGIWDSGITTFKEKPFLGVGSGSFLEASVVNSDTGIKYSAHNSYLSVLVENGLVGFIVFLAMLLVLFISAYKIDRKDPIRWLNLTLITAWMILSFASHAEAQKYTWIIFGFIITSYYVAKKQHSELKEEKTSSGGHIN